LHVLLITPIIEYITRITLTTNHIESPTACVRGCDQCASAGAAGRVAPDGDPVDVAAEVVYDLTGEVERERLVPEAIVPEEASLAVRAKS